jgi:transcriptional regulator with XRE-family HTH domain
MRTLSPREGHWIRYILALNGITQASIARRIGCSEAIISQVLRGHKNSEKVKSALISALGYTAFEDLIAQINPKEGVA